MDVAPARRDLAHRLHELRVGRLLEHVAARPGAERLAHVGRIVLHREHQHAPLRRRDDLGARLDAGAAGHDDVEQDDVGLLEPGRADPVVTVARLADDLDVVLAIEQEAQAGADDRVIVDDENANRHGSGTVPRPSARVRWTRSSGAASLEARGVAVAATVRAADQRGAEPQDHLPDPEAVGDVADPRVVPLRRRSGSEVRQPRLELDDAVVLDPPAWGVERRLRVVAVVDDPADDLEVTLRLHRARPSPRTGRGARPARGASRG